MPKAIQDWLKDEPISRQRKWQIRKQQAGLCITCGEPAINTQYCQRHATYSQKHSRKWRKNHPELAKKLVAAWHAKHPDYNREYCREYYRRRKAAAV